MTDQIQIDGNTPCAVEVNAAECQAICEMTDMIVRSQGIAAAQAALQIFGKFDAALKVVVDAAKGEQAEVAAPD